jgi:ribonuclease HII
MQRAIATLGATSTHIIIDGNALPKDLPAPATAIIKGDLTEPAISAASILAKNARDRLMIEICDNYPEYGFSAHKGYGTAAHTEALNRLGPCPHHRMTFAPVRKALALTS